MEEFYKAEGLLTSSIYMPLWKHRNFTRDIVYNSHINYDALASSYGNTTVNWKPVAPPPLQKKKKKTKKKKQQQKTVGPIGKASGPSFRNTH